MEYIVMSAVYEIGRYGHDKIKRLTTDAHTGGKYSKFVIMADDLIDPTKPPTPDNFRFETIQAEHADIVLYDDGKSTTVLKGKDLLDEWVK